MSGVEIARAILDASVAVRWLAPEVGSREALALYADHVWLAPRLVLTEVASGLRRKVSIGDLSPDQAIQCFSALLDAIEDETVRLRDDETIVGAALLIAIGSGHKLPDCVYLALAEREGARLVTADVRLADLAQRRGVPTTLLPSA